ncbi:unnamed protein product [Phaeothamnion confervicola]
MILLRGLHRRRSFPWVQDARREQPLLRPRHDREHSATADDKRDVFSQRVAERRQIGGRQEKRPAATQSAAPFKSNTALRKEIARHGEARAWMEILRCLDNLCTDTAESEKHGVTFYNLGMHWLRKCGQGKLAVSMLATMRRRGYQPNAVSYSIAAAACNDLANKGRGLALLEEMRADGVVPVAAVFDPLIRVCLKAGDTTKAISLLQDACRRHGRREGGDSGGVGIGGKSGGDNGGDGGGAGSGRANETKPDSTLPAVTFNACTYACAKRGDSRGALAVLAAMKRCGGGGAAALTPTAVIYAGCIAACVNGRESGEVHERKGIARRLWGEMRAAGIRPNVYAYASYAAVHARSLDGAGAVALLREMEAAGMPANPVVFGSCVDAFLLGGDVDGALVLLREATEKNRRPKRTASIGAGAGGGAGAEGGAGAGGGARAGAGAVPDARAYLRVVVSCGAQGRWRDAVAVHEDAAAHVGLAVLGREGCGSVLQALRDGPTSASSTAATGKTVAAGSGIGAAMDADRLLPQSCRSRAETDGAATADDADAAERLREADRIYSAYVDAGVLPCWGPAAAAAATAVAVAAAEAAAAPTARGVAGSAAAAAAAAAEAAAVATAQPTELDLHGHTRPMARAALRRFLADATAWLATGPDGGDGGSGGANDLIVVPGRGVNSLGGAGKQLVGEVRSFFGALEPPIAVAAVPGNAGRLAVSRAGVEAWLAAQ